MICRCAHREGEVFVADLTFNEHSEKAKDVMEDFEDLIIGLGLKYELHFKDPDHDIARRFLNEIVEFKTEGG